MGGDRMRTLINYAEEIYNATAKATCGDLFANEGVDLLAHRLKNIERVFMIGNGGSGAACDHMANDLCLAGVKAQSLTNTNNITCIANDFGFENIFAKQLEWSLSHQGSNMLIAFSCSGKSPNILNRAELDIAYRSNWLAKRIVNAPAEDATREWRHWQATNEQIEKIEELENLFDLQRKLKQTIVRARLYGGAALIMGVEIGRSDEELDYEAVGKDDLKFIIGVNMFDLAAGPVNWDVTSPWYGRPEYYTVSARLQNFDEYDQSMVQIHPSRVIAFTGHELPDPTQVPNSPEWGDSVLIDCDEIIKDFGMVVGGIANMVNDAKMDVVKIPDFSKNIATQEYASRLLKRFSFANQSKSSINSLLLDSEEEWQRIQTAFSGLPNLLSEFLTVTSGASGIPVSRLMGQAPGKVLSGTSGGEQDMRNYYDTVAAMQKNMIGPSLEPLDKVLIASAIGKIDPNIFYEWAPLYVPDPQQTADIALKKAQVVAADVTMGLINPDVLRRTRINQLIEDGTYPGIEEAVDEMGEEPEEPEIDPNSPMPSEPKPKKPGGGGDEGGGGGKLEITHKVAAQDFDPDQLRAPKGSPEGGQWVRQGGAGPSAVSFVSPNTKVGVMLPEAKAGMQSLRQKKLRDISDQIDEALGIKSKSFDVLGAWSDGAEPSVMTEYKTTDLKSVVAAAAMKGALANQKAVLVFQKDKKGDSYLLEFQGKGTLEKVNKDMLEDGVTFHTLEPITDKSGRVTGANVIVWAGDKDTFDAVEKGANRYGSKIQYTQGTGQFIGTELEDVSHAEGQEDAQRVYEETIAGTGSDRIQEIWRDISSASGEDLLEFQGLTDKELALSVTSILDPSTPSVKARSRNVEDIAKDLNERARKALREMGVKSGQIEGPDPVTDEMLARLIAHEVETALTRSGRSSTGWYSDKVDKAVRIAALTHNELGTDANMRMAYTAALAITSQGEVVPSNVRLTEQAYATFKDTGKFPTNIEADQQIAMNNNFAKLNAMIETNGLDWTREFLSKEFTVRELKALGYPVSGENMDTKVYGSAIFGSKIGQGFYQNLSGNYAPMTFDLWWMRGWGRLTGTLVGKDKGTLEKQKARFTNALKGENYKVPRTGDALMQQAKDIIVRHELDYAKNSHLYKSSERTKSELTLAAERFVLGQVGINEQPTSGGDRQWMRDVGAKAIELLNAKGIDITPADLQATWWYPEKDLYGKLGGRDSEAINVDYASALANVARARGISEDEIRRILG